MTEESETPIKERPWKLLDPVEPPTSFDAERGITAFSVGMFIFGFVFALWYTAARSLTLDNDPVAPLALIASVLFGGQALFSRRWPLPVRLAIVQVSAYLLVGLYIAWRYVLGNPFDATSYILICVFGAVALAPLRAALWYIGFAAVWTIAWSISPFMVSPADLPGTLLATAMGGLVAFILAGERKGRAVAATRWRNSYNDLRVLLHSSEDPVFHIAPDGAVGFANDTAEDWCQNATQCSPDTARFWHHLPTAERSRFEQCFQNALDGERAVGSVFIRKGDVTKHWQIVADPVPDNRGALVTLRDVTASEEHQSEVNRRQDRVRVETLNMISHELNTPLMPILVEAHVMSRRMQEAGSEEDVRRIDSIERNARRAINMVDELIRRSGRASVLLENPESIEPADTPPTALDDPPR